MFVNAHLTIQQTGVVVHFDSDFTCVLEKLLCPRIHFAVTACTQKGLWTIHFRDNKHTVVQMHRVGHVVMDYCFSTSHIWTDVRWWRVGQKRWHASCAQKKGAVVSIGEVTKCRRGLNTQCVFFLVLSESARMWVCFCFGKKRMRIADSTSISRRCLSGGGFWRWRKNTESTHHTCTQICMCTARAAVIRKMHSMDKIDIDIRLIHNTHPPTHPSIFGFLFTPSCSWYAPFDWHSTTHNKIHVHPSKLYLFGALPKIPALFGTAAQTCCRMPATSERARHVLGHWCRRAFCGAHHV